MGTETRYINASFTTIRILTSEETKTEFPIESINRNMLLENIEEITKIELELKTMKDYMVDLLSVVRYPPQLPIEMFSEIFKHIDCSKDKHNFSMINRQIRESIYKARDPIIIHITMEFLISKGIPEYTRIQFSSVMNVDIRKYKEPLTYNDNKFSDCKKYIALDDRQNKYKLGIKPYDVVVFPSSKDPTRYVYTLYTSHDNEFQTLRFYHDEEIYINGYIDDMKNPFILSKLFDKVVVQPSEQMKKLFETNPYRSSGAVDMDFFKLVHDGIYKASSSFNILDQAYTEMIEEEYMIYIIWKSEIVIHEKKYPIYVAHKYPRDSRREGRPSKTELATFYNKMGKKKSYPLCDSKIVNFSTFVKKIDHMGNIKDTLWYVEIK